VAGTINVWRRGGIFVCDDTCGHVVWNNRMTRHATGTIAKLSDD